MENIRAVIVDDSPFSITLIKDILISKGIEVVGTAGGLEEVKEVVARTKPALVTMDMTMPGTDGLECTREVHAIDKSISVIFVSAMMDDEIVQQARKAGACAYIQKPVDPQELLTTIQRVMASEELYEFLLAAYPQVFREALRDSVNRMAKSLLTYEEPPEGGQTYLSEGVDIIIGIIGKFAGNMLLGMSKETACKLASAALQREPAGDEELTAVLGELGNIVAGNACSLLNRSNKALGLRTAPPSILFGENIQILPSDFPSETVRASAAYGKFLLNIGFTRSEGVWT